MIVSPPDAPPNKPPPPTLPKGGPPHPPRPKAPNSARMPSNAKAPAATPAAVCAALRKKLELSGAGGTLCGTAGGVGAGEDHGEGPAGAGTGRDGPGVTSAPKKLVWGSDVAG